MLLKVYRTHRILYKYRGQGPYDLCCEPVRDIVDIATRNASLRLSSLDDRVSHVVRDRTCGRRPCSPGRTPERLFDHYHLVHSKSHTAVDVVGGKNHPRGGYRNAP